MNEAADMSATAFSPAFLDELSTRARASERLRQHSNLHHSYNEACQRLFNAIEPESYIRPHRHMLDPKVECLIAVRGLMTLVSFDDEGNVVRTYRFGVEKVDGKLPAVGVEIQPGTWHTVVANTPGAVLFEVKAGPFDPSQAKEYAPWAPAEGSPEAAEYLRRLHELLRRSA